MDALPKKREQTEYVFCLEIKKNGVLKFCESDGKNFKQLKVKTISNIQYVPFCSIRRAVGEEKMSVDVLYID